MENQLKSLSVEALKAKIYDSLVVVENHQQFIKILNQELASRVAPPVKDETTNENNKEDIKNDTEGASEAN